MCLDASTAATLYLALNGLERGYADPRWGGYRQIQEAGGHVRKGERGTPIMYVDFRQRRTARDGQGNPIRDEEGRPKLAWVQRDRPLVKLHHVFNVEQTHRLKLRSLETAAPEWEDHERAEQPVAKVAGPAWSRRDLIPYTEDPWRWARDRQHDRGRRSG